MTNITTTPDFEDLKEDIINHYKNNPAFLDYNYSGASINHFIDGVTYAIHYLTLYNNFQASEVFLDSAQKRSSVVSRAKEMNYTPSSMKAAKASVKLTIRSVPGNPATIVIDKGTMFTATLDSVVHRFVTSDSVTVENNGSDEYEVELTIYQGVFVTESSVFDDTQGNPKFKLLNQNADTEFLSVNVTNSGQPTRAFKVSNDITKLTSTSRAFFIEEDIDEYFQIYFGNNVIGERPVNGATIDIEYLVTNGSEANGITTFQLANTIAGSLDITIETIEASSGGAEQENIESVKLNAPKWYQTANRAVTAADIKSIVTNLVPSAVSVNSWGGENNVPARYSKTFVSLMPSDGVVYSNIFKEELKKKLKSDFNIATVRTEFTDPDFIYVDVDSVISYNPDITNKPSGQIKNIAHAAIEDMFNNDLKKFNKKLRYSTLVKVIDESDVSIVGNSTNLKLTKKFSLPVNSGRRVMQYYSNPLTPRSITSNLLNIDTSTLTKLVDLPSIRIVDVPQGEYPHAIGNLILQGTTSEGVKIDGETVGHVNYLTGEMYVENLLMSSLPTETTVNITAKPETSELSIAGINDFDIDTNGREQIIVLNTLTSTIKTGV